jgi:hypothetical protein
MKLSKPPFPFSWEQEGMTKLCQKKEGMTKHCAISFC